MQHYMKNQIVWEGRKEDLTLQIPEKPVLNGNSETKKYVLSLHKYAANPFPDNDLKELTSRWLKKRENPEKVYSESKIVNVVKVQYNDGHGQKFMSEIVINKANGEFLEFSKSDYKYLYKNDIEDLNLMCINGKIKDCQETRLLASLNAFIRSCLARFMRVSTVIVNKDLGGVVGGVVSGGWRVE
ncbi:hypothetical protein Tco_1046175 [Tanacetum coccineum]